MDDIARDVMKAALWEEAKGKLRALARVQGSYTSADPEWRSERWEQAAAAVENFIHDFESRALHE